MPTHLYFLFLFFSSFLFLLYSHPPSPHSHPHNRRVLHHSLFPLASSSASSSSYLSPTQPPSPSFPKYPSSTTSSSSSLPFFPVYPSPPPPSPTQLSSLPTFPANLSSLHSSSRHFPTKLLSATVLSLLSLLVLLLSLAAALHLRRRRRRAAGKDPSSDSLRLFPPASSEAASDFLYLGTVVSSRSGAGEGASASTGTVAGGGSPELRPLPPLPRHVGRSPEEEFYSPQESPARRERLGRPESSSMVEKCASRDSTLSSGSDAASNLASSLSPSSPTTCSSPGKTVGPPPLPPPPMTLLRPLTPSPPKRGPSSASPPYSPPKRVFDGKVGALETTDQNSWPAPPPPPPPLPSAGKSLCQVTRFPAPHPPILVPPRHSGSRNVPESKESMDTGEKSEENIRPKLKPLHWDKVRASSGREMVWDKLKSNSFQLNEEMIEALFVCNTKNISLKESSGRSFVHSQKQENGMLDPKKSQNIAILLKALNVSKGEVCEALLEGNSDSLGNELLEELMKMVPTKEEELKLKEYRNDSPLKLGPAEEFLKALLDVPFAFKRVVAMLYIASFDSDVNHLRNLLTTLEAACEELRSSRMFRKLLEAVLKTGNRMNVGTNRGDAEAFKLDTLLKLVDVRGTDGKTTLLHFVVQEIAKAEGCRLLSANSAMPKAQANTLQYDLECKKLGLQVVSRLGSELSNVKKAAAMDSNTLSGNVSKLAVGIGKIHDVLRLNAAFSSKECSQLFHNNMSAFLNRAEGEIQRIQAQESITLSSVKETTEYFHGDSAKEEAHPFRIFTVVRDFLVILDQVCKEAGQLYDCTVSSTPSQISAFPRFDVSRPGSPGDERSSS
ncbi:formin-like protein 1 [Typha angustifolia]|uniref:formin-like protein 1 n=1 Tax=Typha angustifolia TaxID=59011 RepID=UPI003C2F6D58